MLRRMWAVAGTGLTEPCEQDDFEDLTPSESDDDVTHGDFSTRDNDTRVSAGGVPQGQSGNDFREDSVKVGSERGESPSMTHGRPDDNAPARQVEQDVTASDEEVGAETGAPAVGVGDAARDGGMGMEALGDGGLGGSTFPSPCAACTQRGTAADTPASAPSRRSLMPPSVETQGEASHGEHAESCAAEPESDTDGGAQEERAHSRGEGKEKEEEEEGGGSEDVGGEQSVDELHDLISKGIRRGAQLVCEVFVEFCTAARTQNFIPDPADRAQCDGLTLPGSAAAYAQRFAALEQSVRAHVGTHALVPLDRISFAANFDCFPLLHAAAAAATTAPNLALPRPPSMAERSGVGDAGARRLGGRAGGKATGMPPQVPSDKEQADSGADVGGASIRSLALGSEGAGKVLGGESAGKVQSGEQANQGAFGRAGHLIYATQPGAGIAQAGGGGGANAWGAGGQPGPPAKRATSASWGGGRGRCWGVWKRQALGTRAKRGTSRGSAPLKSTCAPGRMRA